MNFSVYFFSPFEQFIIIPIFSANLFIFGEKLHLSSFSTIDYTISNITLIFTVIAFLVTQIIQGLLATLQKHLHVKYYQQVIFLLTVALISFLLFLNLSGNLPIFMSLASQFAVISAFSLLSIFVRFLLC